MMVRLRDRDELGRIDTGGADRAYIWCIANIYKCTDEESKGGMHINTAGMWNEIYQEV